MSFYRLLCCWAFLCVRACMCACVGVRICVCVSSHWMGVWEDMDVAGYGFFKIV